jgi:hypothetical protein
MHHSLIQRWVRWTASQPTPQVGGGEAAHELIPQVDKWDCNTAYSTDGKETCTTDCYTGGQEELHQIQLYRWLGGIHHSLLHKWLKGMQHSVFKQVVVMESATQPTSQVVRSNATQPAPQVVRGNATLPTPQVG